ncbi:MAG: hypothetical protein ACJAS2_001396 [Pseudohongiellaceae bacterium]|jgi:hypothetical protein
MHNSNESENQSNRLIDPARRSGVSMAALKKVLRARTRLLVCFATFPVYAVGVWFLLSSGRSIDGFMFVYMGLWSAFAFDMTMRKCPACNEQFFVRSILMSLRSKKCVHCGLDKEAISSTPSKQS